MPGAHIYDMGQNLRRLGLRLAKHILIAACVSGTDSAISSELSNSVKIYDWKETVRLEHQDRKRRFERLSEKSIIGTPVFYDDWIKAAELPDLGTDIPVLRVVLPQRVFFDTDRSTLRPEAEAVIAFIAENLKRDVPDVALFVAGHADSRGSDGYNYTLSVERADAVSRALFSKGIGTAMIWRIGFGEAVPIKPNTSDANMAENRRVEFLLASRPEAVAIWLARQSVGVCSNTVPSERDKCRDKIDMMPPLTAVPVLNARRSVPEQLPVRDAVGSDGVGESVPLAPQADTTSAQEERQVVQIERTTPVIIDLREERVTVGRPEL